MSRECGRRVRAVRGALRLAFVLVAGACDEPARDVGVVPLAASALTVCAESATTTFGIDVSKWQGTINWPAVAGDGVRFAFIRVSDGTGYIDQKFGANWSGAGAQGILRGAYQFFRADESVEAQAQIVLDHLAEHGAGELPPVIDVESADGQTAATIAANVGRWIDIVEAATGRSPIIYTGRYFWDGSVKSDAFADRALWIAHWTSAACPGLPTPWDDWDFWQYSATGRVAGISGDVDLNRFEGTLEDLRVYGAGAGCGDCGIGATCEHVLGEPTCVELACTTTFGGPDGRACAGASQVFVCEAGTSREEGCTGGTTCVESADGAACEVPVGPDPEPEPSPEPAPEPGPEPGPEAEVEPSPEVVVSPGVVSAQAGPRHVSTTSTRSDPGCAGGAGASGLGATWLVALIGACLVRVRRKAWQRQARIQMSGVQLVYSASVPTRSAASLPSVLPA